jgi:membrane dipeptidase
MRDQREPIVDVLRRAPLIDGHADLLYELRERRLGTGEEPDVGEPCPLLQTDLPRLREGAVGGQFWSVFVPSDLPEPVALTRTLEQIDALYRLVATHPDDLALARTADDVERVAASGRIASMIGVEGGHSIASSLGALRMLAALGAGYMTLTHADDTPWADSATGQGVHGGLTRFGEEVVRELNRSGVLVDCSHVSDDTMRQAIEVSEAPVLFSHSSARALSDVPRNVPDDVLEQVGRTGGVVMVTFVPAFVAPEGAAVSRAAQAEAERVRAEHPDDPEAVRVALDAWFEANGRVPATVEQVADHVDHVRDVAGIDAVGIGSDFDGAPAMPDGLEDVSRYPTLFAVLADRGYTDDELARVAGRNVLRLMREAEGVAQRLGAERRPSMATIDALDD